MTTINPTFTKLELKRIFRDPVGLFFTAVLPAFMYVIFGATQSYKDESAGNGNVAMWIMVSMAAYGAVTATTSIGGLAAVEKMQGWGRQLGLTPMPDSRFIAVKVAIGVIQAALPVTLIYAIGFFTNAKALWWVWASSAALVLLGALLFSLYGLTVGSLFKSENAVGVSSGLVVIFGFLGNVFVPLSGWMLTLAKFTPLYGIAALARRPLTEGYTIEMNSAELVVEPLWQILANVGVWVTIFAVASVLLVRKGRERQ